MYVKRSAVRLQLSASGLALAIMLSIVFFIVALFRINRPAVHIRL